jgi:hypothetical protein
MNTNQYPKACVIGAGSSGLSTIKALKDQGVPFDCFEVSDNVGGVWYYQNPSGMSACYKHLHINTSRCRMEYEDYPMPAEWPNFCRHDYVARYFNDYCDHFGLRDSITFNTRVEHAERGGDGLWTVTLSGGEQRIYDALIVCNGHHWDPRWPEPAFPGQFNGKQMHSHDYRQPEDFAGRRVVILGVGNSAMDIAVELSYTAEKVYLAHRRGTYIVPKFVFGRALDQWRVDGLPRWFSERMMMLMLRVQVGKVENFGIKKPEHSLLQAHPTISSTILDRIAHGDVTPKDNIASLEGDRVKFADGSSEEVDTIIYCTGYKVSFPFFDETFISAHDNDLPLYRRMFKPEVPNLAFIGLYQPLGAIFPLAERQGRIMAAYLSGQYRLPTLQEMQAQMAAERARMFARYVKSKRHTMQVDFEKFILELDAELKAGRKRAKSGGTDLPVPPRADALVSV